MTNRATKLQSLLKDGYEHQNRAEVLATSDRLDKLKSTFKRFPKFYHFLIYVASPVFPSHLTRLKKFVASAKEEVVVNFGSGNSRLSEDLINIDIFDYERVDLVTDISRTPLKDGCVDKIVNVAVLEHVPDPQKVLSEMKRVLRPGGEIFCFFPFIQGFHASPHDYSRMTYEGLLWVLQEWFAILFSFGSKTAHKYLYLFFMVLTFPLKALDLILLRHPCAKNISSGFTVVARKPE